MPPQNAMAGRMAMPMPVRGTMARPVTGMPGQPGQGQPMPVQSPITRPMQPMQPMQPQMAQQTQPQMPPQNFLRQRMGMM